MNINDKRDLRYIILGMIAFTIAFYFLFKFIPVLAWILFMATMLLGVELSFSPLRTLWAFLKRLFNRLRGK